MSDSHAFDYGYQVGGTIAADSPVYVERSADAELLAKLEQGQFCYVFNSRQMGKSSLRVRTQAKLLDRDWFCASIDLTNVISDGITEAQFYNGLMAEIAEALDLDFNRKTWLAERGDLSPVQQFGDFVAQVVLVQIAQPIAIFLDEIDSTLRLTTFSIDPFFARIRSFYNQRSERPEFQRLTFCLLGVAAPSQLIRDRTQTPFNIGQAIELSGLALAAALGPLGDRLPGTAAERAQTLTEILDWTGGQPFLTQRLCALVRDRGEPVATLVQREIVERWQFDDPQDHFKARRDRLLEANPANLGRRLGCLQRVLASADGVELDSSEEELELRLVGLVRSQGGRLRVYNRIYGAVFDSAWVAARLAELRPYEEQLQAWLKSGQQDESYLLHNIDLDNQLQWAEGKRLPPEDEFFFRASQQLALREERVVRQTLEAAKEKADQLVKAGQLTLAVASLISVAGVALSLWFSSQQGSLAVLNRRSLAATERFQAGEQLESLVDATKALQDLQATGVSLAQVRSALPVVGPLDAVQNILEKIREKNQLQGHSGPVFSVSWSPDGKTLATGSRDGTVKLWNVTSGQAITTLQEHRASVRSVSWSPDGKTLATGGSRDSTVKLWNVASGQVIATLQGHSGWVLSVSWSPDGKTLATGSRDGTVKLWNVTSGQAIATLQGHSGWVLSVSWSPDGKTLATGSSDSTVKLWNVASGQAIATLQGHRGGVLSVSWSPDGKTLATGSSNKTVKLWKVPGGQEIATLQGYIDRVNSVSWSPDSKILAIGSDDKTVKLWDLASGQVTTTLPGHRNSISSVSWSPDGKTLATGSSDSTVKLWNFASDQTTATLSGHRGSVNSVSWSPDGRTLATGSSDSTVKLWNFASNPTVSTLQGHRGPVNSVSWSPNGKELATASGSFVMDGRLLSRDNMVRLWNVASGQTVATLLPGHDDSVNSVSWSPNGKTLATGSSDTTVQLWNVASAQLITTLEGHRGPVNSVSWSPDGKTLATASGSFFTGDPRLNRDNTVKLWNVASGQVIATLQGHDGSVLSVSWSPDGKTLATGSSDKTVKLWNVDSRQLIATLQGHENLVMSMSWSPDSKILATGGADNTVRLWHVASGQSIATLRGHRYSVRSVSWSPDGRILATGSDDNTVKLWPMTIEGLLDKACTYLKPYLTNPDHPDRNNPKVCDYPPSS